MAYTKSTLELPPRAEELDYDDIAPGLYPDEAIYELDTGQLVAVSIRTDRHKITNGLVFQAWARAIEEDGSTRLDTLGEELEIEHRHPVDQGILEQRSIPEIAKDVMHLLLGEPVAARDVDGAQVEWIALPPDVRNALSIRSAIKAADEAAELNVADILA